MVATVPVDHQLDCLFGNANNDLVDQSPDNAFARCRCCAWTVPGFFQISTKCQQSIALLFAQQGRRRNDERVALMFKFTNDQQAFIPTPFQFTCDKSIIRIDIIILSTGTRCLITCLFQRQIDLSLFLFILATTCLHCCERGFHAQRLDSCNNFVTN